MNIQGTLKHSGKESFLSTEHGDFGIHSFVDAPKVSKLPAGTILWGVIKDYTSKQARNLKWDNQVGTIETGHLHIGPMKE